MKTLDPSIELRLVNLLAAHPELDQLEVVPHASGFAVRVTGSPGDAGQIVAARSGDLDGVDWSYRKSGGGGFGFGTGNSKLEGAQEQLEVLSRLKELAATGRVTH